MDNNYMTKVDNVDLKDTDIMIVVVAMSVKHILDELSCSF